jgi:protein kinase C substrate 80K-H
LKEGFLKRQEMSQQGKTYRKDKDSEKSKLEAERQHLEAIKQEKERVKEEVETPEKEALERYRILNEEKNKKEDEAENAKSKTEAEDMFNLLDSNGDGKITKDEITTRQTFDRNKDGVVSEDEALFFLNMEDEMSKEEFLKTGWLMAKPFFLMEQGMFKPPADNEKESEEEQEDISGGKVNDDTPEPPLKEFNDDEIEDILQKEAKEEEKRGDIPGVEEGAEEEEEGLEEEEEHHEEEPVHEEEPSKYDEQTQKLIDGKGVKIISYTLYLTCLT